jgi:zinc transporter ZupT
MSTIQTALLYTLIPLAAAPLVAVIAASKPPRGRATSAVQHFAAGVIFAAAAIELLPALKHSPRPLGSRSVSRPYSPYVERWIGSSASRGGTGLPGGRRRGA